MDLELSHEQRALVDTFSQFFARECPTTRVRAAEPLGFDEGLWDALVSMEVATVGARRRLPIAGRRSSSRANAVEQDLEACGERGDA
jgi:hypothetical protein